MIWSQTLALEQAESDDRQAALCVTIPRELHPGERFNCRNHVAEYIALKQSVEPAHLNPDLQIGPEHIDVW